MGLAFVVQRYGAEVAGGAEALCRDTARALVRAGEHVTVYTTTARDYLTWAPHYASGTGDDDGVTVKRFAVEPPDPARAADLVRHLGLSPGDPTRESEWARAQGPVSVPLLRALADDRDGYRAVVLWTYLYATSQMAMPIVRDRAILVPLAHEEPMLRFDLTRGVVRMARAHAFMTPEERALVEEMVGTGDAPGVVVGAGLEPSPDGDAARAHAGRALPLRFALYLGRVDAAKGVDALVRAHSGYRARGGDLGLVLAGRAAAGLTLPEWVVPTGFISNEQRADLLAAADVVVLPSPYESLSLVALEAWRAGRPTLAYARAAVLAGQTARSGGGLLYTGPHTYGRQLARLAASADERLALGESGRAFAGQWTWDACIARWRELIALMPLAP